MLKTLEERYSEAVKQGDKVQTVKYKFLITPSHGYLIVPLSQVRQLQVKGIYLSKYSVVVGNKAYLEEDCDKWAFLDAKNLNKDSYTVVYGDFDKSNYPSI